MNIIKYLRPSKANMWFNCTESILHNTTETKSEYTIKKAEEGSFVHELIHICLKINVDCDYLRYINYTSKNYPNKRITQTIIKYVNGFLSYINNINAELLFSEIRLSLNKYIPNLYGTCDLLLFKQDTLYVIDFKYGKYPVEAHNNEQLLLYSLGAIEYLSDIKNDINSIINIIYQPRTENPVKYSSYGLARLEFFGKEIIEKIENIKNNIFNTKYGEWCTFCNHKNNCNEYLKHYLNYL